MKTVTGHYVLLYGSTRKTRDLERFPAKCTCPELIQEKAENPYRQITREENQKRLLKVYH